MIDCDNLTCSPKISTKRPVPAPPKTAPAVNKMSQHLLALIKRALRLLHEIPLPVATASGHGRFECFADHSQSLAELFLLACTVELRGIVGNRQQCDIIFSKNVPI